MRGGGARSLMAIERRSGFRGAKMGFIEDRLRHQMMLPDEDEEDWLFERETPSTVLIDGFFRSFALVKLLIWDQITGFETKFCAAVILSESSVLTTSSCFDHISNYSNVTQTTVITGIDTNTIGLVLNGNMTEDMNETNVYSRSQLWVNI